MKKAYEKPLIISRQKLAEVTATTSAPVVIS
jgi:hypothetical protein